jgi:aldehyde:ferredoxin oxidoreductase
MGSGKTMSNYHFAILRVDLSTRKFERVDIPEKILKAYIGGSGLGAFILLSEMKPEVDPLGEESLLLFLTGPLTGTPVFSSGRHSVIAKSPLTGVWGEANVGGFWGRELRKAGLDGILVSGVSDSPVYLWINDGHVEIREAEHLWGKDTFETDELIRQETDRKAVVSCIGPAGENQVRIAGILTDGVHGRVAARCGLGAVSGAKRLKAIAVKGSGTPVIMRERGLRDLLSGMARAYAEGTTRLRTSGTAGLVIPQEQLGSFPIKNFTLDRWEDGARKISWEQMKQTIFINKYRCAGCSIGCGRSVKLDSRPLAGMLTGGPEYESLSMLGSNLLIDDLFAIQRANELCNRLGLDTIDTGSLIGFAMEAYERGLINKDDCGLDLAWGNQEAALSLIAQMGAKEGLGEILSQGLRHAARVIGGEAESFAMHVKGMALPAHDPRAYNSVGLGFATSNRGACHLQGFTHVFERSVTMPEIGIDEVQERFGVEGKGEMAAKIMDIMCLFDSLSICKFALFGGVKVTHMCQWLNMVAGWDLSLKDLLTAGERIFNAKRFFNVKLGIRRKDDTLPERLLSHPKKEGASRGNLPPMNQMLDDYYKARSWGEDGVPTSGKLKQLGLSSLTNGVT